MNIDPKSNVHKKVNQYVDGYLYKDMDQIETKVFKGIVEKRVSESSDSFSDSSSDDENDSKSEEFQVEPISTSAT
jgi:hypothetical protein